MATPRQTKLQRIAALLAEVTSKVDSLAEKELDWVGDDVEANGGSLTWELHDIKTELGNLVERASESDPNKRTYNKATADKVQDQRQSIKNAPCQSCCQSALHESLHCCKAWDTLQSMSCRFST